MAKNKTVTNNEDVETFLSNIENDQKRIDAFELLELMRGITKERPKMWGKSIVGFGEYHYVYESGREGDMFITGFSPRKQDITIYIMTGFGKYKQKLIKLGKHRIGKSCLYLKKLENVDQSILKELITDSMHRMINKYP